MNTKLNQDKRIASAFQSFQYQHRLTAALAGIGLMLFSGNAAAHASYTGTTMTNGNGAFLDRITLRKDLASTVIAHAPQNAASAGIGVASGLAANNGAFSSYSNIGGVITSRLDTTVGSSTGWIEGLNTESDSHRVKFFGFELGAASKVDIYAEALAGIGTSLSTLIPSISVYSGMAPSQAHDEAVIPVDYTGDGKPDPFDHNNGINPPHYNATNQPGAVPLYTMASGQNGVFFASGNMSMYNNQWERFDVAGLQADFTAGNTSIDKDGNGIINQTDVEMMAPEFATLLYLGQTFNISASSSSWSGILGPGSYTFLVGGSATIANESNHGLRVNFTAAPVPIPAAVWLFGSTLAGWLGFGRRKQQLLA